MDNAASEKQVKQKGSREERRRHRDQSDLKSLSSLIEFRRFIRRLTDYAGLNKSSLDSSGSMAYYKIGRRDVTLWIKEEIRDLDPKLWSQIELEEKEDEHV